MSLCLHFEWTLPRERTSERDSLLATIAASARRAGWSSVLDPLHLDGPACDCAVHTEEALQAALVQACRYLRRPGQSRMQATPEVPSELFLVRARPSPGGPEVALGLRRFGAEPWDWRASFATSDADVSDSTGIEDAVRAHLALVALLDELTLHEIGLRVGDDTEYWTTRDRALLTANLRGHRLILGLVGGGEP